jgi:hypothetical protein
MFSGTPRGMRVPKVEYHWFKALWELYVPAALIQKYNIAILSLYSNDRLVSLMLSRDRN